MCYCLIIIDVFITLMMQLEMILITLYISGYVVMKLQGSVRSD